LLDQTYSWLRRCLDSVYTEELGTKQIPLTGRLVAPTAGGEAIELAAGSDLFAQRLGQAFTRMRGGMDGKYPLTVFCSCGAGADASRSTIEGAGWETMLEAVIGAGFTVEATWPIRTEQPKGHLRYPFPPAPEVILVCRARPLSAPSATHRGFLTALQRELPSALSRIQSNRLAPVDLAQSSLGAGLAIFSRYASVRMPDGSELTVRQALDDIRRALRAMISEQSMYLDPVSRFALAAFDRFGYLVHTVDEARAIARRSGTTLVEAVDYGLFTSRGPSAQLIQWHDLDARWHMGPGVPPLTWKATHHLLHRLKMGDMRQAAALLAKMAPELRRDARELAFQLYAICDRKGRVEDARAYADLTNAWEELQAKGEDAGGPFTQQRLF
jgi:putative DNA methylase